MSSKSVNNLPLHPPIFQCIWQLTLKLLWVTKTEFLLTASIQYKQTSDDNNGKYKLWDY